MYHTHISRNFIPIFKHQTTMTCKVERILEWLLPLINNFNEDRPLFLGLTGIQGKFKLNSLI